MKLKYTFELRKRLIGAANKVIEYPKLNGTVVPTLVDEAVWLFERSTSISPFDP